MIKFDFKNQKIRLCISDSGDVKINDLSDYLSSKDVEFTRFKSRYLTVNASDINPWLADIFINVPTMGTFELDAPVGKSDEQEQSDNIGAG